MIADDLEKENKNMKPHLNDLIEFKTDVEKS